MARRMPKVGEVGVRYGSRNYLRTHRHMLMAKRGKWHLVICPDKCMGGWVNVKLHLDERSSKNAFEIGVKDGRPAPKADVRLLMEHHPNMLIWALEQVKAYVDGKIELKKEAGTPVVYTNAGRWKAIAKG